MLNKLPCLDKGWVAFVDSSLNSLKLRDLKADLFYGEIPAAMYRSATLTLAMKAPLFVSKALADKELKIVNAPVREELDAYLPNEGEIAADDLETSRLIAQDMERTTAALLINIKAYQEDGCNKYLAQLLTPVNVYTVFLATGTLKQWKDIVGQGSSSNPMRVYLSAIQQVIAAEWADENGKTEEDSTGSKQQ